MVDLYNRLQPILDECHQQRKEHSKTAHAVNSEGHTRINVAIIGLPNVVRPLQMLATMDSAIHQELIKASVVMLGKINPHESAVGAGEEPYRP